MPFGSFLMLRELLAEAVFRRYAGTCHAYTGVVWEQLERKAAGRQPVALRCMASPTVVLRGGQKSWKDYKARIYLYDIPHWLSLLPAAYAEQVNGIRREHLARYGDLLSLLAFRRSGQLNRENCRRYLAHFNPQVQRQAALVAALPPSLARVLRFLLKTGRKLRP